MNRQIGYITSAHLLLISVALGGWLVSKIPFNTTSVQTDMPSTPTTQMQTPLLSEAAARGKILFMNKCGACHLLFKDMVGPPLSQAITSPRWSDRKRLYAWIRNPAEEMKKDPYLQELKKTFGSMMQAFPALTDQDIDDIVLYISALSPLVIELRN